MDGYYPIGEVSKVTGISKDTLHFYNKIGLLTPDYTDPQNQYRYYSRWNLWQLDIITVCRKLDVPLKKVREILESHDNLKIVGLLQEYREEALRLSAYYMQVAEDISWYGKENERIRNSAGATEIHVEELEEETVVAGMLVRDTQSYHANLQEAAREELKNASTIQRKYGYILDPVHMEMGKVVKLREYLKITGSNYTHTAKENLFTLPSGRYAVFTVHIKDEIADFSPFFRWLQENNYSVDMVFAEELGLQLFDYLNDYYCEVKARLAENQGKKTGKSS